MTVRAHRLDGALTIDGDLDEEIYRAVEPTKGFIQQLPQSGQAATDDTAVWVFFDADRIYIAARCLDSEPTQIVANERRRDNQNIWLNDNVIVVLDTFADERSGFFFQTNPVGGQRDALIIDEATTNYDWNTVWDVRSRRMPDGWATEMSIPFKSLRYKPSPLQVWGLQVMRMVRRNTEQTLLAPVPASYGRPGFNGFSSFARLVGLEPPGSFRNVELKPYATSNLTTNRATRVSNDVTADLGFDAKYSVTSSLTADFTYNTDFAQVEIDEQQVNLTRFSLFFPEKRDFFLDGQGIFEFAGAGARRAGTVDETPILFYSRRIGLNGAQPTSIRAGARLMGRAGRFSLGVMNIQTDEEPVSGAVATNFSVVRVKRDIFKRSNIGLLMTNRSRTLSGVGSNQVYGLDANMSFYQNVRVNGYYARSETTGLEGDTASYRGYVGYLADRYGFEADGVKVGDAFNPETGFLRRTDFRRTRVLGRFSPRLEKSHTVLRQLNWQASVDRFVGGDGGLQSQEARTSFRMDYHNGDYVTADYSVNEEVLFVPFTVARGVTVPVGGYRFQDATAAYQLGPQRVVSGTLTVGVGGFYGGAHRQVSYSGRIKASTQLAVEPRVSVDWIDVPQGKARVTLLGARPIYTITPRMFVAALMQFNTGTRALETNARWRWEYQSGSDLYVVYTDGRDAARPGFPDLLNRSLAIKVTRFLRF